MLSNGFTNIPPSGEGTKLVSSVIGPTFDSLSNTSIPSNVAKITEVGNNLEWVAQSTFQKAIGLAIPKDFGALTNSLMTNVMNNAVGGIAQTFPYTGASGVQGFETITSQLNGVSGGQIAGADVEDGTGNGKGTAEFGVKLQSVKNPGDIFFCEIMPLISESGSVQYDSISPTHHPGSIEKYTTTPSREWNIGGIKLASVTIEEATYNQKLINLLRSWRMPYYGLGTAETNGKDLGAPPDVLTFSAYGDKNIGKIPVVLSNLSIEWPNDVDYIHTSDGQPFPVLINISISLKEAWSPRQFSGFSIEAFKSGDLANAYLVRTKAQQETKGTNSNESQASGEAPVGKPSVPSTLTSNLTKTGETVIISEQKKN
jgi:hypothetical protein